MTSYASRLRDLAPIRSWAIDHRQANAILGVVNGNVASCATIHRSCVWGPRHLTGDVDPTSWRRVRARAVVDADYKDPSTDAPFLLDHHRHSSLSNTTTSFPTKQPFSPNNNNNNHTITMSSNTNAQGEYVLPPPYPASALQTDHVSQGLRRVHRQHRQGQRQLGRQQAYG